MRTAGRLAVATAACVAFAVFVTWPQAAHLSTDIPAHHDAYFNIWRLGWIAHALTTQPLRLFDANIFHPTPNTLAYSDATMLEGLLGAPLFWAGASPALVSNLLMLAGYAGSGLAMFVLVHYLTRAVGPSLVAAASFAMMPYRIEHFMHLELQWAMFIPLTFWAVHRAFDEASWRIGALAGLFFSLQMLACVYYGVFLGIALAVFVPLLILLEHRTRLRRLAPVLAAMIVCAIVITVPFVLPYRAAAQQLGGRAAEEVARYSATPSSYLATTSFSRLWSWTGERWGSTELRLFPGATVLLLLLAAPLSRSWRTILLYGVVGVTAVELSFGSNGMLYGLLVEPIDALHGLRSWSRFAVVVGCALAVLAAVGTQALLSRVRAGAIRHAIVVVLLLVMCADYSNRPLSLASADPVEPPDVYKVLRKAQPGALMELPLPELSRLPGWEPYYSAWSLWHWRPLVNGYSGYYPGDYVDTLYRMLSFPDDGSIGRLRGHDVRYVIVHRSFYDQEKYTALMLRIASRPELKPWGTYRDAQGLADMFELLPE